MKKSKDPYIALAQKTIQEVVEKGSVAELPPNLPQEMLTDQAGVFVSLHVHGKLRGCIGTIEATTASLAQEIQRNAVSASTRDPRFPAVSPSELEELEVSVDVLGPNEKIAGLDELDVDRYGVIVEKGYRRGLLLPRLEGVNNAAHQVAIALEKAGIKPHEEYEMYRFQVTRHEDGD